MIEVILNDRLGKKVSADMAVAWGTMLVQGGRQGPVSSLWPHRLRLQCTCAQVARAETFPPQCLPRWLTSDQRVHSHTQATFRPPKPIT